MVEKLRLYEERGEWDEGTPSREESEHVERPASESSIREQQWPRRVSGVGVWESLFLGSMGKSLE